MDVFEFLLALYAIVAGLGVSLPLLLVPILLYLVSHLAVPDLEDGQIHDMREYYYRHLRWTQSLLLAALVCGTAAQHVIEGRPEFVGPGAVRAALAAVLLPGVVSRNPLARAGRAGDCAGDRHDHHRFLPRPADRLTTRTSLRLHR